MEDTTAGREELGWEDLDHSKFFAYSTCGLMGVRTLLHPLTNCKTRLQVQENQIYTSTLDVFRKTIRSEGFRGLYKGLKVQLVAILPSQVAYIGTLEVTKHYAQKRKFNSYFAHLVSGAMASITSTIISVPIDILSQRQMISGVKYSLSPLSPYPLNYKYSFSNIDAMLSIYIKEGIRGLYRGFGASLLTYTPSSALWWSSYSHCKKRFKNFTDPFFVNRFSLEPAIIVLSGVLASITAGGLTHPLDVARTRLQVQEHSSGFVVAKSLFSMLNWIYRQEGLYKLWTKGLGARITSMSLSSVLLVTSYETVKKIAKKNSCTK